jgi:hypothetical protein
MQENTSYIQTQMNKDHFWKGVVGVGNDEQGHHRWAQMVATNDADKALETNAVPATGMDLVYFNRFKTATENPSAYIDAQPFVISNDPTLPVPNSTVMQLLGIRAMILYNVVAGVPALVSSFNVAPAGLQYQGIGRVKIVYTVPLPSDNYFVLGGGMVNAAGTLQPLIASVTSATAVNAIKRTVDCDMVTTLANGNVTDPLQAWFIMFGG